MNQSSQNVKGPMEEQACEPIDPPVVIIPTSLATISFLQGANICDAILDERYRLMAPLCTDSGEGVIYLAEDLNSEVPSMLVIKILGQEKNTPQVDNFVLTKLRLQVQFFAGLQQSNDNAHEQAFVSNFLGHAEFARLDLPEDDQTTYRVHYLALKFQR